jgi:hypothetical protein
MTTTLCALILIGALLVTIDLLVEWQERRRK